MKGPGDELPLLAYRPPRARRTDPDPSHQAATRAETDGTIKGHARRVVLLACLYPGFTAKELAGEGDLTTVQIDRRAHELEEAGWIVRPREEARPSGLPIYPTAQAREWFASWTRERERTAAATCRVVGR